MSGEESPKGDVSDELTNLGRRLSELERYVSALETQVVRSRERRGASDRSMRARLECPACGHREIIHAKRVLDEADGSNRKKMAVRRGFWPWAKGEGEFEAYICRACGLTEWRVDVSSLETFDSNLVVLRGGADADGEGGPYR